MEPPRLTGHEACPPEAARRLVKAGGTSAAEALTLASATPARADLLALDPATLVLPAVHVA